MIEKRICNARAMRFRPKFMVAKKYRGEKLLQVEFFGYLVNIFFASVGQLGEEKGCFIQE